MSLIQKLRQPRLFEIAIFDVVATLAAAHFIHKKMKWKWPIIKTYVAFFILGIVIHKIMGIDTQLGFYLGLNKKPIR
jgi:hypothetical protein